MQQELFHVFGYPIYGYGLMMVVGFFLGAYLAKYLARRVGLDAEIFMNAALLGLIAGVVGARASHVIENWGEFTTARNSLGRNLLNIVNVRNGGLTFYGGFLLAFPVLVLYGIKKKVPIPLGMDIIAPCLMVGLAMGRVGCFLNGCCYGAECELPWKVQYPYHSIPYVEQYARGKLAPPAELLEPLPPTDSDRLPALVPLAEAKADPSLAPLARAQRSLPVHPAQLYSTLTSLLLAALLLAYFTLPHAPGRVFALMCMVEGTTRFLLEMLRVEDPVIGRMSLSMVIGAAVAGMGVVMWVGFGRTPLPGRVAAA